MSREEWEALCDGCGWCCLYKLQDEDSDEVFYTRVACRLLDMETCRCRDYANRHGPVPECMTLTPENVPHLTWLPPTCAYRLLLAGEDLPDWHALVCGDPWRVHRLGHSPLGLTIAERQVGLDHLEDYLLETPWAPFEG